MPTPQIKATAANRKILREHAKEALANYSRIKTWLLNDPGNLRILEEPQGQRAYLQYMLGESEYQRIFG